MKPTPGEVGGTITNRLGIVAAAGAALFLFLTIGQPMRLNWGDPWSDGNAMTSGRFFARYGFVTTRFTPILDVQPLRDDSLRYLHYPPLPDLINGVEQKVFGASDISIFRILAVLLSLAGLFFFFRFVRELWGATTANIAVVLLATSLLWLQYADTIQHIPIYWSSGFASLYFSLRWIRDQNRRSLYWVFAATLLCFLSSYDFGFFLPITAAASAVLLGRRLLDRVTLKLLAVMLAAGILFIAVKSALGIWAVGWPAYRNDLLFQFHERSSARYSVPYRVGLPLIVSLRLWRYFGPVFFAVVLVQVWMIVRRALPLRMRGETTPRWIPSPLIMLAAGLPFVVLFTQLFVEQQPPALAFLPYYAIGCGAFIAQCMSASERTFRVLGIATLVLAIAWQMRAITGFEKVFLARKDIAQVQDFLDANDHHQFVLSNGLVDAPFRYYWNRHVMGVGEVRDEPLLQYIRYLFDEYGPSDIHFVHFSNFEKHLFDKGVFVWFGPMGHWDWIGDPAAHKADWEPFARRIDARLVDALHKYARLRVQTEAVQVYSFSRRDLEKPAVSDAALLAQPIPRHIEFGAPDAEKYELYGFGPAEHNREGDGFAWMQIHQHKRLIFTVRGLKSVPDGPLNRSAALRLNLPGGHGYRVRISTITGTPQVLRIRVNGSPVIAELPIEEAGRKKAFVFELPARYSSASGLQELQFDYERAYDEWGLAVALFSLDISDSTESPAAGNSSGGP